MNLTEFWNGLEKASADSIKTEQGDYYNDEGLLMCGKCNTPKQCKVNNPFIAGRVDIRYCICKCAAEAKAREELNRRVARNREACFPESRMKGWTFDKDDGENVKLTTGLKNYVEKFHEFKQQGKGLLLYGDVGRGKTYGSACVANALLDEGYSVLMTDFTTIESIVSRIWDKQEYYNALSRFDLLIIDDLSVERKTEYMEQIVQAVINTRYNAGLPLIITTNLTGEELQSPSDMVYKRIFSRLYEMCIPVKVEGKDRRTGVLKSTVKANLLGL